MQTVALTIAGSDPSGGAGVQADLKTFHQHGVYGTAVLALLTVQNTRSVEAVQLLEPAFVSRQLQAVVADLPPQAAKTGALGSAEMIEMLADHARNFAFPLVVDPVMVSKHGQRLIDQDAVDVLRRKLLPHAFLITPNLAEAAALADLECVDESNMEQAAATIAQQGAAHVLIKGGHSEDNADDLLWTDGEARRLHAERIAGMSRHGTGCVLSAAITARLACGEDVLSAVTRGKRFITRAIESAPDLGGGHGPTNMHAKTS